MRISTFTWCLYPFLLGAPNLTAAAGAAATCPQFQQHQPLFSSTTKGRPLRVLVLPVEGTRPGQPPRSGPADWALPDGLDEFLRQELGPGATPAGLSADNLQSASLACAVNSHAQARALGQLAGVDLVVWGTRNPPHTVAKAEPGEPKVKTYLTVVNGRGAQLPDGHDVQLVELLHDLEFPPQAAQRPRALFNFLTGIYAFHNLRYQLAASRFQETERELQTGSNWHSNLYRLIGISYLHAAEPTKGMALLEQALSTCEATDSRCRAEGFSARGWAKSRLYQTEPAVRDYEKALLLATTRSDVLAQAQTLTSIGDVYGQQAEPALSYYEKARRLFHQLGDASGEATTFNKIGWVHKRFGPPTGPEPRSTKRFAIKRRAGDELQALAYFQKALPLLDHGVELTVEAQTYCNLGFTYSDLQDDQKALAHYQKALPLYHRVGDLAGEERVLFFIGKTSSEVGAKQQALRAFQDALTIEHQLGSIKDQARTLDKIGSLYSALGDTQQALGYYEQALPLYQQLHDVQGERAALEHLRDTHQALGNKLLEESYRQKALRLQPSSRW